jgi:hypothetical protein
MILDKEILAQIQAAWEPDTGAMWKLREGVIDAPQIEALLRILEALEFAEDDLLPR